MNGNTGYQVNGISCGEKVAGKSTINITSTVDPNEKGGCALCGEVLGYLAEVEIVEFNGTLGLSHKGCLIMHSESLFDIFHNQNTEVEMVLLCDDPYCEW